MAGAGGTPKFGPFFLDGETWRLCEDADVRARDLAHGTVTVLRPETGEVRVFSARALQHAPVPGLEEVPDQDRYDLRLLIEDILSLGFDSGQAAVILGLVTRRRLLRERGPG